MKLITFRNKVQFDSDSKCVEGKKYIISNGFLSQIKDNIDSRAILSIEPFIENPAKRYIGQDLTNKSLLVWRTGGMGDLCFITPNLRYIKETFSNSKVYFGCGPRFKYGLIGHPYIDKLLTLPIDYEMIDHSDYYLMFEGIIENNPHARQINAYDLFEKDFGFSGKVSKEKKNPVLPLSKEHVNKQYNFLYQHLKQHKIIDGIKMIGLGLRASHIIRSIPVPIIQKIIELLIKQNILVSLIGGKEDGEILQDIPFSNHPLIYHMYRNSDDFRDAIAHISMLDGIVSPDSGTIHIASACKVPSVGIYGPFPSRLRLAYYQNCSGFDVKIPCGPCFLHGVETCEYSDIHTKEPLCMYQHNPELICSEILSLVAHSGIPHRFTGVDPTLSNTDQIAFKVP